MPTKEQLYRALVDDVQKDYLSRPRICNAKGVYLKWANDCQEINLWTYWQGRGNYDAKIMLVGQDWGPVIPKSAVMQNIKDINSGLRTDYDYRQISSPKENPTDKNLCTLFSTLGYELTERCADLFFTNFVLGYRSEGLSGNMMRQWLRADAPYFSRLVNIIEPKVIICLGKDTFENVLYACTGKMRNVGRFNAFIESAQNPVTLPLLSGKTTTVFGEAHCGTIGTMNRNRTGKYGNTITGRGLERQIEDWKRIKKCL